jgi:hypothetical protein
MGLENRHHDKKSVNNKMKKNRINSDSPPAAFPISYPSSIPPSLARLAQV